MLNTDSDGVMPSSCRESHSGVVGGLSKSATAILTLLSDDLSDSAS